MKCQWVMQHMSEISGWWNIWRLSRINTIFEKLEFKFFFGWWWICISVMRIVALKKGNPFTWWDLRFLLNVQTNCSSLYQRPSDIHITFKFKNWTLRMWNLHSLEIDLYSQYKQPLSVYLASRTIHLPSRYGFSHPVVSTDMSKFC